MTQITQNAIADAFDTLLQRFGPAGGDINLEGTPFTPQAGKPYLTGRLLAYTRVPLGVGPDSPHAVSGVYQIRVNRPAIAGLKQARAIAAQLVLLFARGTALALATGQTVTIESASEMPAVAMSDWLSLPVSVTWYVAE